MGSVRPSIARGYELDVIAMVVLGGVINTGGKGRVIGVVISTVTLSLLRYGLGISNVPAQTIMIVIGSLLIIAVAIPNLRQSFAK
jgi:rhamnose transport system permease protein